MAFLKEWTFSADGNGDWFILTHRIPFEFRASGDFGGGTLTFESSPAGQNGANEYVIPDVESLTANGTSGALGGVLGDWIRPVLTGSTSPDLIVYLDETVARV